MFLYSHDTFGLGHLRRNFAIADELLRPEHDCEVWLLSGSPVIRDWELPDGLCVQPLPPVVKAGAERYAARSSGNPFSLVKDYREALILNAVMRERPDVMLVDHAPAGMKSELLSMLATVRQDMPRTRLVLGLRDIIDSPEMVCRLWQDEDNYALLEHAYDRIVVYGTRELFDVAAAYRLPPSVAARLSYVGDVARSAAAGPDAPWPGLADAPGLRVLVTAGGGGDGHAMMAAYLTALSALPAHATASRLVPGPLMPPEQAAVLARTAAGRTDVALLPYTTDLLPLVAQAELVVAMGGYNTAVEILAARKPAILVPRATPRAEQAMRAALLRRCGPVRVADEGDGLAARLAALLPEMLTAPAAAAPPWQAIDLDGARRTAALIGELAPAAAPPCAAGAAVRRIGYVMIRYPRLNETFIHNEIRAMEQAGERFDIVSLLPPEPPPHHPLTAEVAAPVHHLPLAWGRRLAMLRRSHALAAAAVGRAMMWSVLSPRSFAVWMQFLRAGFVATLCREHGITHLHVHFANAPAAVARFAAVMTGLPFSFTTHAKDLYLTPERVLRKRTRAAAFVFTCTQCNADDLRRLLPQDLRGKVHRIYHGLDLASFRYRPPPYAFLDRRAAPLILAVARLVSKKGLGDLIAARALLARQGMRFRCRIVGAEPLRDALAGQIAAQGLADRVSLDGAMMHQRLIDLFATADLFALAPRIADDGDRDGIPNVIVEAMATGVPVVAAAASGIPELVEHERTGLLVPSNDAAALAAAMARLLAEPALGRHLAAAARARLERHFDFRANTRMLSHLVGSLSCETVPPPLPAATPIVRPIPVAAA